MKKENKRKEQNTITFSMKKKFFLFSHILYLPLCGLKLLTNESSVSPSPPNLGEQSKRKGRKSSETEIVRPREKQCFLDMTWLLH